MPEETFFTTLSHNPQLNIPGSYLGKCIVDLYPVAWKTQNDTGKWVKMVKCIHKTTKKISINQPWWQ